MFPALWLVRLCRGTVKESKFWFFFAGTLNKLWKEQSSCSRFATRFVTHVTSLLWHLLHRYIVTLLCVSCLHGPFAKYVVLWVAHTPGITGSFSPPLRVSYPDMRYGTCVADMPWCKPGSLTGRSFEVGGVENVAGFPAHAQPTILSIW